MSPVNTEQLIEKHRRAQHLPLPALKSRQVSLQQHSFTMINANSGLKMMLCYDFVCLSSMQTQRGCIFSGGVCSNSDQIFIQRCMLIPDVNGFWSGTIQSQKTHFDARVFSKHQYWCSITTDCHRVIALSTKNIMYIIICLYENYHRISCFAYFFMV